MAKGKKPPLPLIEDPTGPGGVNHIIPEEREACVQCALYQRCHSPVMGAYVPDNWTGRLLIVCEAPGGDEDKQGRPLVGKAGQFLFKMLESVGIREEDCALTNANRCWPGPGNPTPSLTQIRLCRPFLGHDALRLRPQWILALGDNACKALFNGAAQVKRCRQRAYDASKFFGEDAEGIKVAFSYHPASCFYQDGPAQKQRILEDLKWLVNFKGYITGPDDTQPEIDDHVGLDIEWSANHELLTVGQAVGDHAVVTEDEDTWSNWLSGWSLPDLEPYAIGHSIFGDLAILRLNGQDLPLSWISGTKCRDSLLLARLENENRGAYDLESLSVSISGIEPWKSKSDSLAPHGKTTRDFSTLPPNIRMERCRVDAWATAKIATSVISSLDPKIVGFSHQLAAALKRVEMAGVKIDPERYAKLGSIILRHLEERRATIKGLAGKYGMEDFEASNDNHFRTLLFDRVGAKPDRLTTKDKLPAVDHAALVLLYQTGSEEVRAAVLARLRHEKADKLYSTYIGRKDDDGEVGLAKHLSTNYFVFQNINPLGARTGRRSSDHPNMQNWPKRMRAMAVSRFPGGSICKGDESQLEPRLLAYVAGIDEWQELFERGDNLYLYTAKKLWKKDVEKDTALYKLTKSTILGSNYCMEELLFQEKMAVEQGIILTLDQARFLLRGYLGLYPGLTRFFAIQKERLLRDQQVSTLTGQIRHLPCPDGEKTHRFKHLWNQAVNFPIQGLAAFVTGSALLDLESAVLGHVGITLEQHYDNLIRFWATEKLKIPLDNPRFHDILEVRGKDMDYPLIVNEVHDELVVDTPEKDTKWLMECLKETMEQCPTLRRLWPQTRDLKLKAEVTQSDSWAG